VLALCLRYMTALLERRQLRGMERLCLEQAELCVLPESRQALRVIALNYRAAAEPRAQAAR
jgi:hypothetical protein